MGIDSAELRCRELAGRVCPVEHKQPLLGEETSLRGHCPLGRVRKAKEKPGQL